MGYEKVGRIDSFFYNYLLIKIKESKIDILVPYIDRFGIYSFQSKK